MLRGRRHGELPGELDHCSSLTFVPDSAPVIQCSEAAFTRWPRLEINCESRREEDVLGQSKLVDAHIANSSRTQKCLGDFWEV